MCTGPGGRGIREKKEIRGQWELTEMAQVKVKVTASTSHTGTPPPQALFFQKQVEAPVSEGLWHRHRVSKTALSAFLKKRKRLQL